MKTRWLVSVVINGRDAGSWSREALQPWTAIYAILRYGICAVGTPYATRGLRDVDSVQVTVTRKA